MAAAPSSPDHSPEAAGGAEDVVAGIGPERALFPGPAIAAGRDDRDGVSGGDRRVAGPGVIGAVCTHLADGLVSRYLIQQIGQDRCVANARAGDLDGADFQRFRVNPKVNLCALRVASMPRISWRTTPRHPQI